MLSVNEKTFSAEVLESNIPVLVNFEAPWCGLCRIVYPLLLKLQTQCGDRLKLVKVNADENFKLSTTYKLHTLPTLLLIDRGTVLQRMEGFSGREDLIAALNEIKVDSTTALRSYRRRKTADYGCRSA